MIQGQNDPVPRNFQPFRDFQNSKKHMKQTIVPFCVTRGFNRVMQSDSIKCRSVTLFPYSTPAASFRPADGTVRRIRRH